ncbi:MAG: P-II family nitrogen regulator [Euryarchaeota archaeon]|nr:P-II family nitrogen regulator [Euryarchaeota archaeon]
MKKVEAILRPERFERVREDLERIGIVAMTVTRVEGRGRQMGKGQSLREKTKVEIVVEDEDLRRVVQYIAGAAKTGEQGDGRIFILPVEEAVRIRTGESSVRRMGEGKKA